MSRDRPWSFTIDTLPGSPDSGRLRPVFELLFGDDELLKTMRLADSALDPGDAAAFLAEQYPVYQSRSKVGHQMFVYGPGDDFVLVALSLGPGAGGHLSGLLSGTGAGDRGPIEHLGPQHFFDVETGRLPTALPAMSAAPSFAVTVRDPASGELETISG